MQPYYADDLVTLYHGDCREILPGISADVLVTDPPYGIEIGSGDQRPYERGGHGGHGHSHGLAKKAYGTYEDTYANYVAVVCPVIEQCIAVTRRAAVFTGPHMWELPKPSMVGGIYCPTAAGRGPWGFKSLLPVLFYGKAPALSNGFKPTVMKSIAVAEKNGHPCPKPLPWMRWLVGLTSLPGETILDPFAGSGTTLRAAADHGRKAVGIEINERYCEIAARRLGQGVLMTT